MQSRAPGWQRLLWLGWGWVVGLAPVASAVLYDGSLNTAPSAQGWLYFPTVGVQTLSGSAVTLDPTAATDLKTGYGRASHTLDAAAGYTLSFSARLNSEAHARPDRAGFSVIAVSSVTAQAVELGFWSDEVWAQSAGFIHAEGVSLDTASGFVDYDLVVQGSGYELYADGVSVLSGATRDYFSASGRFVPYGVGNSIFFGDNTTSAIASFSLAGVELGPALVPEPLSAAVWVLAEAGLLGRARKSRG